MNDELERRKEKIFSTVSTFFNKGKGTFEANEMSKSGFLKNFERGDVGYYLGLLIVLIVGFYIRTRNIVLLHGKYLLGLDPYFFLRYSRTIIETGGLPVIDYLRYAPAGYPTARFQTVSYMFAYSYKLLKSFLPSMSLTDWHIIYGPVVTIISFVVFFFLVKELFEDKRVALLSTAFLAVVPAYIYRTGAGFADHEGWALLFMFIAYYFFIVMWKAQTLKKGVIYSILSAIAAGLMIAAWGGGKYLSVSIALFLIFVFAILIISKKQGVFILTWLITYTLAWRYLRKDTFWMILTSKRSLDFAMLVFIIVTILIYLYLPQVKEWATKFKLPPQFIALLIASPLVFIPGQLIGTVSIQQVLKDFAGFGFSRFQTTVSESMSTFFFNTWWNQFGWSYLFIFLGSIYLFYVFVKDIGKWNYVVTAWFGVFHATLILSILSNNPKYVAFTNLFAYNYLYIIITILVGFGIIYLLISRDYRIFEINVNFRKIFGGKELYLLIIVWFSLAILLGKGSSRLLLMVAPPGAIVAGYFVVNAVRELAKHKKLIAVSVALLLFTLFILFTGAQQGYNANRFSGSGLPGQWEASMDWIRENTPEGSVIGHWWDYGYWTQTVGERASVGDGGNNMGWNHYLGREVMTGRNPDEYLSYMKTHTITHILYSNEEIGKYWAYSFIGSDESLDRASTIGVFSLATISEIRNGERLVYNGYWPTDNDIVFNQVVIPRQKGAIRGISIERIDGKLSAPTAHFFYNGQQYDAKINCVCSEDSCEEISDATAIPGCIKIIPVIQGPQQNNIGAIIWLSDKVSGGLFGELYIKNTEISYFNEVYHDNTPLAVYVTSNGASSIIGPTRIWEVTIPDYIEENEIYLERSEHG